MAFWLLGSHFLFSSRANHPDGREKRESSFPAESASSLAFTATSPNSKHIFTLLQFSPCVMTASTCHDSGSERADEKNFLWALRCHKERGRRSNF